MLKVTSCMFRDDRVLIHRTFLDSFQKDVFAQKAAKIHRQRKPSSVAVEWET